MALTVVKNSGLSGSIDLTSKVTGTLPVPNGGIGIASGTTDQFLKFTGSTTLASAADNTGGLVLIERIQGTGDIASIAFNGKITTTYTKYMLYIGRCANDSDAEDFRLRFLNSSNTEYDGGHYTYGMLYKDFGNGNDGGDHGQGQNQFGLASGHNGSDNTPHFGQYFLYCNNQTDSTDRPMITGTGIWHHEAQHDPRGFWWAGSFSQSSAPVHGLKLYASSGDLSDYDVSLFGIKDT